MTTYAIVYPWLENQDVILIDADYIKIDGISTGLPCIEFFKNGEKESVYCADPSLITCTPQKEFTEEEMIEQIKGK